MVQLSTSALTADEPNKREPRIVVLGVPTSLAEEEGLQVYFWQVQDTRNDVGILTLTKLNHRSGKRDVAFCSYIIEVYASIRKILIPQS